MTKVHCYLLSVFIFVTVCPASAVAAEGVWIEPVSGLEFVRVPGGCYRMGQLDNEKDELVMIKGSGGYLSHFGDELPAHEVCVSDFYMGKHEITVAAFRAFADSTGYITEAENDGGCQEYLIPRYRWELKKQRNWRDPGFRQEENEPVVCVSWNDAGAFGDWLSENGSGRRFRLATEAEWEYAARSGGLENRYGGSRADLAEVGWFVKNSPRRTSPVGTRRATNAGIHDLSGNVWEWVGDTYHRNFYRTANGKDPVAPEQGGLFRVVRGGGWNSFAWNCRTANRDRVLPSHRDAGLGFRLVFSE